MIATSIKNCLARLVDVFWLRSYKHYDFFEKSQWWSEEEFKKFQLDSLKKLGNKIGIKIDSWEDFEKLPFMSKTDLRNFEKPTDKPYHVHNTSGSTGYPLSIYLTHDNWGMKEGMFLRHWAWMGRKKEDLVLRLISGEPKFSKFDWLRNVKPMNFRDLNNEKIDWIIENRPKFIHCTVFTARQIVQLLKNKGRLEVLKDITLWWTNENTGPHYEEMSGYFKDIYHGYGLAELTPVATQCEFGELHIIEEMAVVEEIGGKIVVTNPFNEAMPIVRYQTGDTGRIVSSNCQCGRKSRIIKDLKGKGVDFYAGPEFRTPIDWLVVSPISKKYIDFIDTWRAEVKISKKILELSVKWKSEEVSKMKWYADWLREEYELELIIKDYTGDFPDKQLLRIVD